MKAERKAALGGATERLGQHVERLGVVGRRHLEDVEGSIHRRIDQGNERRAAHLRELLDLPARSLVGQLGDENRK